MGSEYNTPMRVRLEAVSKRFGAHAALRNIDLDVNPGECLVLLGPSGCGKTTLLRLLAGLERADSGRIWIGDRVVNDLEPSERDVAMVFQNYALYPHFTAFENIAFPLRARRVAPEMIDQRVKAAAARVALETMLDRRPAQLSGGQQQRVALARAIVRNPAVYLMDEPLSNLDAQLRLQTRTELKRLHQELGTTMVYVTHDQAEAMTLATRIAIMERGEIVQTGAPLELYRRPINTFVAGFLGSPPMNLLPVSGTRGEGRGGRAVSGIRNGVQKGIRAEDVQVGTTARDGWGTGSVLVVEPMGSESLLTVDHAGTRVVARVSPDLRVDVGQEVWIHFPQDRLIYFDEEGRRIASDSPLASSLRPAPLDSPRS
jgi:multiple sugar transport system ATP-binding protein